mmetsp:Transcript_8476/g.4613  ORF Transcript_8476/g.4613 Transcript_8476/m.4613 type:complete len:113 (-) Transcript_8476:735-1073(-)
MKPFSRTDRVARLVQKNLSDLLLKRINDPRLETAIITSVKMSSDIRLARIYFVVQNGANNKDDALEAFNSAYGFIKRIIAKRLGLRYMPDMKFYYDESFDYGENIDNILSQI